MMKASFALALLSGSRGHKSLAGLRGFYAEASACVTSSGVSFSAKVLP